MTRTDQLRITTLHRIENLLETAGSHDEVVFTCQDDNRCLPKEREVILEEQIDEREYVLHVSRQDQILVRVCEGAFAHILDSGVRANNHLDGVHGVEMIFHTLKILCDSSLLELDI